MWWRRAAMSRSPRSSVFPTTSVFLRTMAKKSLVGVGGTGHHEVRHGNRPDTRRGGAMQYLDTQLARQLVSARQGRLRSEAARERLTRPARRRGDTSRLFDTLRVTR